MLSWLKKINPFAETEDKTRKQYQPLVEKINRLEPHVEHLSDEALRNKTDEFRTRLKQGETLDDILPEAFALVREASRRTIGLRHYDVQLIGGIVLHQGKIAEMKTGEGKTLVATLPLYLNGLTDKGVHLVTVNDYLARRDAGWMGPVYHLLGMRIGFIGHEFSALFDPDYVDPTGPLDDERLVHWRPCTRREAYEAEITYGTNNEFGFDYLRDNMVQSFDQLVQRPHHYAIVDEVDNILIDEARTPLIISGPASKSSSQYARFAHLVTRLRAGRVSPDEVRKGATPDGDVLIDLQTRSTVLTEEGLKKIEEQIEELGPGESVYDPQHANLTHYLENALKAKFIFHRDRDYVVQQGEVIIVDEFTGRLMPGRRWSDGLHQAVEAKEGVDVRRETVTYATITFQNYFRMYEKLAGMTGTAATEKEEFGKIYNLDVAIIPTNRPCIREDFPDLIYRNEKAKFNALIKEIKKRSVEGQPILVGTTAVETSERLSERIKHELRDEIRNRQIQFYMLNAKQNADEAAIIAQAGRPGTITIATNMAGRGTDILLGGNAEAMAARYVKDQGFEREQLNDLAQALFGGPKAQKLSPQTVLERSGGKLTPDLIAALQELHDQYEQAIEQIEQKGEHLFLIDSVLSAVSPTYYEQKRALVRAALQGNYVRARKIVRDVEGMKEEMIAEIVRLFHDTKYYRTNRKDRSDFLAGKLFDRIYTARAKLVQLVLRGELDQAHELVAQIPGLKAEFIDGILQIQQKCQEDQQLIKEKGGLHVIGTERHEARRIDNQLRGRSGRQGDKGSSRFYLSLEDDLMKRFGRMDKLQGIMETLRVEDDVPIESAIVSKTIESAQVRVEGFNFDMRKHTVEYDDVMNKQREVIYARRRRILEEAEDQRHIETLLERYFSPDHMIQEIQEEIRSTATLSKELAYERLKRLLPDVAFDGEILRSSSDEHLKELLEPLVREQQQQSIPLLVEELSDFLAMPDDAEEQLSNATYEEAKAYIKGLWQDQREGDLEDRIKELFRKEFDKLIERYLGGYEQWVKERINQAIDEATSPANDEVNILLVQRYLKSLLPDIELLDPVQLARYSADKIQRELEDQIQPTLESGHNIRLFVHELAGMLPLFPPPPHDVFIPNLPLAKREYMREQYLENYRATIDRFVQGLDDEDQENMKEKATSFVYEQLQPLFVASQRITHNDKTRILSVLNEYNADLLFEIIDLLDNDAVHTMLMDVLDHAFEQWRTAIGDQQLNSFQRRLMMATIDREWQEYLTAMEDLRQGIGLQAIGQRDPLVQYKTTGFRMFNELLDNIDQTVVRSFFQQLPDYHRHMVEYQAEMALREQAARSGLELRSSRKTTAGSMAGRTVRREMPKTKPNDLCPCGSGKKYKHCHGKSESSAMQQVQRGRDAVSVANSGDAIGTTHGEQNEDMAGGVQRTRNAPISHMSQTQRGRSAPFVRPNKKKPKR